MSVTGPFELRASVAQPRRKARVENDDYPTPTWCVRRLIEAAPWLRNERGGVFLEPSAGSGQIIRACAAAGVEATWTAVELSESYRPALCELGADTHIGDFRNWAAFELSDRVGRSPIPPATRTVPRFDLALGNPPYSIALEFVQSCLLVARHVCLLLRVGFLESTERNAWIRANTPDLYILPNRPAFRHGSTDSCVYAWHWWGARGRVGVHEGRVVVLADTPLAERKLG